MSGVWYFWGSLALLMAGYLVYGSVVEKVFGADAKRPTPLHSKNDGVDYVKLPRYKIFLIQFLNIAGLGPVLGPILGALYGPSALLWIVIGSIFAGAVHDYCSGMMSLRLGGASYPEIIGHSFGKGVRRIMEIFTLLFMIMVGAVFVLGPAALLASMTPLGVLFWSCVIFAYYFLATLMPIDVIIGRIYPYFGLLLLVMTIGLVAALMLGDRPILPNTDFVTNADPSNLPRWPLLFVTIAFYGPMIAEGVIGLIWATLGLSFYESSEALQAAIAAGSPTLVVKEVSVGLLGTFGGALAILGVVVLPITTGDTAFRGARLLLADALHMKQDRPGKRLILTVPLFAAGIALTLVDFAVIWRYFGWANQSMACVTLWAVSVYLAREGRLHWIATLPALFMTAVCVTYLCNASIGLGLTLPLASAMGIVTSLLGLVAFLRWTARQTKIV